MRDLNFVAIDFETANEQRGSACQVGMAKVIGGEVVDAVGWYTIPPTGLDTFSSRNISIHGITPELASSGYTWPEATEAIHDFTGGLPLVAHNVSFDRSVYTRTSEAAGVLPFEYRWMCSLQLVKRLLPDGPTKLADVVHHLGYVLRNHHDASHDAQAAAAVVLALADRHGQHTVEDLWPPDQRRTSSGRRPGAFPNAEWSNRSATARKDEIPKANSDADPSHPLFGHHFVITGELPGMDRWDAWTAAAQLGAQPLKTLSKKTTTLVVVAQHDSIPADYDPMHGTSKERTAGELQAAGRQITLIGGGDFLRLLL